MVITARVVRSTPGSVHTFLPQHGLWKWGSALTIYVGAEGHLASPSSPSLLPFLSHSLPMVYLYLSIAGFIATILALIPLPRQIRVRNVPGIAASFWFFGSCLSHSINPIIWAGNVNNSAPGWCDLTLKIGEATEVGLPAVTFCICKHLELISSGRPVSSNASQFRRKVFESVMCFAFPCLWLIVFYSFQTARFVVVEDFGCYPDFLHSNIAVGIICILPLLFSAGTLIYGSIALYHLMKHRRMTSKLLMCHLKFRDAGLSSTQYYRLMAMSMIFGGWGLIWLCLTIKYNTSNDSVPLKSWRAIHSTDSIVLMVPIAALGPHLLLRLQILWWGIPGSAIIFFLLFGTSPDVWSEYRKFWVWFRTTVLRWPLPEKSESSLSTVSVPNLSIHIDTTIADPATRPVSS